MLRLCNIAAKWLMLIYTAKQIDGINSFYSNANLQLDCVQFYYFVLNSKEKSGMRIGERKRDPFKKNIYFALFVLLRQKINLHNHPLLARQPGAGGGGKDQFVIHLLAEKNVL